MKSTFQRGAAGFSLAIVVGVILAGCATGTPESGNGTDPGTAAPIVIGSVSSITGPAPFPEVPGAAQAVFDRVNAEGGINGRQIEFVSEDDGVVHACIIS